jgi:hypothetical protein
MYLQPEQAFELIAQCAKRFPGSAMLFDLPPTWVAKMCRRGVRTSRRYKTPPTLFSMSAAQAADLVDTGVPGVRCPRCEAATGPWSGVQCRPVDGLWYAAVCAVEGVLDTPRIRLTRIYLLRLEIEWASPENAEAIHLHIQRDPWRLDPPGCPR